MEEMIKFLKEFHEKEEIEKNYGNSYDGLRIAKLNFAVLFLENKMDKYNLSREDILSIIYRILNGEL